MDEPALREGLPLKSARHAEYLQWAVNAFRLATACASPGVQVSLGRGWDGSAGPPPLWGSSAAVLQCSRPARQPGTSGTPHPFASTKLIECWPHAQIVTHLCYSDFEEIMGAIDGLDGE